MNAETITIPNASKTYANTIPIVFFKVVDAINKAKENGETNCVIRTSGGKVPAEVIKSLLDAGYDISYTKFHKGDWFIKAYWEEDKECGGKLLREEDDGFDATEVSIEDYKIA